MIKKMIEEVLKERIRVLEETQDNWDYGIEQCWKKEIDILISDIGKSIEFFLNECTDEEFYWLSEIFEELAEETQSKELIVAFRSRLAAVVPENYNQQDFKTEHMRKWVDYAEYVRSVSMEIDYAEGRIEE